MDSAPLEEVPWKASFWKIAQLDLACVHIMDQKCNNAFDSLEPLLLLEETHCQEGLKNGRKDGLRTGREEGRDVELKIGFEVGEELGFHQGCLDVLNSVIDTNNGAFSARIKNIEQVSALLSSYPLFDPEDEQVSRHHGENKAEIQGYHGKLRSEIVA